MAATDAAGFTFGIEEEFFLGHPGTGNVLARVPRSFFRLARERLGDCVTPELLQSQIELSSPVFSTPDEARATMTRLRRDLAEIVDATGYRLVAAGTHPLAVWHEQTNTEKPRYARLMDDFQIVGRRNVLCGLHVHVAVPPGVDRVQLMNRAMRWLPLLLALSTSSPFWNRQRTGLLSYRQVAYDEWPRTGIPDWFADEPAYRAFVDLMVRAGAIKSASFLWWAIRPATDFPTLELRLTDSCTRLDDSLAIAALFRCLLRLLVRRPELGTVQQPWTRRVIDENRWRAKRDGMGAAFIDETDGGTRPFAAELDALCALVSEEIRVFGCEREMARLGEIVAGGTSAQGQLAAYRTARDAGAPRIDALRAVVDWLVAETAVS